MAIPDILCNIKHVLARINIPIPKCTTVFAFLYTIVTDAISSNNVVQVLRLAGITDLRCAKFVNFDYNCLASCFAAFQDVPQLVYPSFSMTLIFAVVLAKHARSKYQKR